LKSPLPASPLELTVESFGGLGDGIANHEGKPVFIPKACVGDKLNVRIARQNHDGLHGVIEKILFPGPDRTTPPCIYFERCGGCKLQQLSDAAYRAFKTRMFESSLAQAGSNDAGKEMLFIPAGQRRRVEFSLHGGALCFNEIRSNIPVVVANCIALEPALQAIMTPLNDALAGLSTDAIKSVALTAADSGIDLLLTLRNEDASALKPLANTAKNLETLRVSALTASGTLSTLIEHEAVEMTLGGYRIPLPADAFLQATRAGQQAISDRVMQYAKGGKTIADLFCGIGTYSFPLSKNAAVHAVEMEPKMVAALQSGAKKHSLKTLTAEARDLFKKPLTSAELKRFDTVIINPPRVGAKAQTEELAQSTVSTVVMVSCNPATFARDAKILKTAGFHLTAASGIDQFVWSPFLEIVAQFTR
jgi:23S rRNA (uracil1939-C5)-methyltransferase